MYVDSALKKADKLNADHIEEPVQTVEPLNISWKNYKKMNMI